MARRADDLLATVAGNLHRLRAKRGLTVEQLAGAAELDLRFVRRVGRGATNLSVATLAALAEALDADPRELLRPGAKVPPAAPGRPRKKRAKRPG